jgi:hypothetical protein
MQYRITSHGPGKGGRRTGAGRPAHSATLALAFLGRGRPSRDKAKATLRAVGRDVALALVALDDLVRFTREAGPLGFQYFTANADAAAVRLRRLVDAIERGEK